MDKIAMANMESRLRDYFNRDKRTRVLNMKLNILKKQIDEIEYKLRNIKVDLPEESRSITYEERVQTSPTGESYAERTLMRITDKLLEEQSWKLEQVADVEERLRNMEVNNSVIRENIKDMRTEDLEFLKEKYKYRKADWQVGMKYCISQQAATERKKKLLKNIASWEEWVMANRV